MIKNILSFFILVSLLSCKDNVETISSKEVQETQNIKLTEAEKIANAYGYENWDKVEQIEFAFNAGSKEGPAFKRSWNWKPKTGDVTMMTATDTVSYNRNAMDSISMKADRAFINDKYWFLTPFQLIWDEGTSISKAEIATAPLDSLNMNKITLAYGSEGGYTPGDAYDFYYGDDYKIKQWVFRKGNSAEASMVTTWENEETFNGITVVKDYNMPDSGRKIYFTDINVKLEGQ